MHAAVQTLTDVMVESVTSPPVSSRTYAYASVAAYEALISEHPEFRSLAGQLNDLPRLIRPETVINQKIDSDWWPDLQTPPFHEYPSGHRVISAATAEVLTVLFGDDFAYDDDVEVKYGLPVRSFTSSGKLPGKLPSADSMAGSTTAWGRARREAGTCADWTRGRAGADAQLGSGNERRTLISPRCGRSAPAAAAAHLAAVSPTAGSVSMDSTR